MIKAITSFKQNYPGQVGFGSYTPQKGNDPISVRSRKAWGDVAGDDVKTLKPFLDAIAAHKKKLADAAKKAAAGR